MKTTFKIIIAILCLLLFVYHGQALKLEKVRQVKIDEEYEKGKISKEKHAKRMKENTYLKAFLSPKDVLEVD